LKFYNSQIYINKDPEDVIASSLAKATLAQLEREATEVAAAFVQLTKSLQEPLHQV
jgi:hypothetical protein